MKINQIEIQELTNNFNLNNLEEINYTSIDSYTINQTKNSISSLIVLNQDEKIPTEKDILEYFLDKSALAHMVNRLILSKTLEVPLYFISMENNFNKCQILELKLNKDRQSFYYLNKEINTYAELYGLMQTLRNEKRIDPKPLSHIPESDLISKFNYSNISLGGNLDGFYIDKVNKKFNLVEFSKIGAKKQDSNGHYTKSYNFNTFMNQDFGRWHALETLRKSISNKHNVNLDVIVWSFSNSYMKIIKDVKFCGNRDKNLTGVFKEEIVFENIINTVKKIKP